MESFLDCTKKIDSMTVIIFTHSSYPITLKPIPGSPGMDVILSPDILTAEVRLKLNSSSHLLVIYQM